MPEAGPSDWRRFVGAGLSKNALAATAARRSEIRHAIRVSAAVGAAYALATLLRLPQGYWAVFTAVIVVQASIGATITASIERLMGTVVGAVAGAAAAYLHIRWPQFGGLILCVTVALLAFLAAVRPALKVAPVTAVIMLIGTTTHMEPMTAALFRVVEILVGSLVGVAATLLIFPARAHGAVVERVGEIARLNAQLLTHYARVLRGEPSDLSTAQAYDANRAAMAKLQTAMAEASRETASRLSLRAAPEALPRTLWRQRNDIVMIGRAVAQPVAIATLNEPAAAMIDAAKSFLTQTAGLIAGGARPDRLAFSEAHVVFQAAIESLRAEGAIRTLPFDDAARVFGLVFAIENLHANLGDLADRLEERNSAPD
ncbi:MAG: FUSC family protein [Alphaproteobacteria bacterium]|nr:FUSC family protein [Alphaproteobacteria bacterium]